MRAAHRKRLREQLQDNNCEEGLTMPYIRRDKSNAEPNAQVVYADRETEKVLLEAGFLKASGAPYYNRSFVDVIVYDDGRVGHFNIDRNNWGVRHFSRFSRSGLPSSRHRYAPF